MRYDNNYNKYKFKEIFIKYSKISIIISILISNLITNQEI